jgi:GNAT superfamily N-acetyltransferase
LASERDVAELRGLIEASVRGLQAGDYSPAQLERALVAVYGVDTRLIADGTYFVAEAAPGLKPQLHHDGERGPEGPLFHGGGDSIEDATNRIEGGANRIGRDVADGEAIVIVGCGGWSRRKTLYGGDQFAGREDELLDPARDAAKIRAFFVHPEWARRGIGGMILEACERAAVAEGFRRLEMGATLTGVPFYRAKRYVELERTEAPMGEGLTLPIVRMGKEVGG